MVRGLKFVFEPPVLRFFIGKLETIDNWEQRLAEAFKKEVGNQ
jgi:tryptophanase